VKRNVLFLLQGHAISKVGTALYDIAVVLWLKQHIGSASVVGIVLMLSTLPEIILSPFSGTIVDLSARKRVLIFADLCMGLIIIATSLICYVFPQNSVLTLIMLIGGSISIGICSSFFNPAVSSFIPELVPQEKLQSTNSLYQFSTSAALFLGQSTGGVLFTLLSAPVLFFFNGMSYLVSAGSEACISTRTTNKKSDTDKTNLREKIITNLREGLNYIKSNPALKKFLFILCLFHFFISPFTVIMPFFVTDHLHKAQSWYGYFLGAFGVGLLSGFILSVILKYQGQKRSTLIQCCLIVSALCYLSLGLISNEYILLPVIYLIGIVIANIVVNLNTIIQISTPNAMHGRIFGLYNTLSTASIPIGMGFFGIFLDILRKVSPMPSNAPSLIFLFCGIVLCVISFVFIVRPDFCRILSEIG
jgi:MFS transporter, DHA3 family, macrolide efflux protein